MAANPRHVWTAAEFLAFESRSQSKHELVDGEIYDMTGGTGEHSRISANVIGECHRRGDLSNCSIFTSDMMLKATDDDYVYPDLSVVCGQPFYEDRSRLALLNPILVVEVTSQTSATYDRGLKRELYQQMPSVQGYLIIDQYRIYAELYTRIEVGWHYQIFNNPNAVIPLPFIDCELPLEQVYRGISFSED